MDRYGRTLLAEADGKAVTTTSHTNERTDALLQVRGLGVRLGGRTVLDGVDVTVRAGEFVGLIGANGAGKTTLLRAVLGLVRPDAGTVGFNGLSGHARRAGAIGYVPQTVSVDQDAPLRARDVVALGLDGNRLGIPLPSRQRTARVDEMLTAVDALDFADRRVGRLSGGQRQRILIAHALVSRPRLLLLDEPLANLDLKSVQEVVALLTRVSRDLGIAVILTAHDVNPLLASMDRVVYLADGRAVSGSPDEVVRSDVLSALYRSRVDVLRVGGKVIVIAGGEDAEASDARLDSAPAEIVHASAVRAETAP